MNATHKVTMTVRAADSNPNMVNDRQMNHWRCTLRREGKRMTVLFSMGLGLSGEPTVAAVLECLASDAAGYFNANGFDDWASEYGYETDSRSAHKCYKTTERQSMRLAKFMGDDLDALLYSPEHVA